MLKKIISTDNNTAAFLIRIILGIVLFPHGAQKLLGWFGGYGFEGTMSFLTSTIGLPWAIGLLVILIEFVGALLFISGVATRLIAFAVIINFIGIIFTSHIQYGFFMNWGGNLGGEGFEYHLLVIAMCLSLLFSGGGRWSADYAWQKK